MNSPDFLFEKDVPWKNAGELMKRKILGYDENLMLVKMHFEKGAVGALHTHPHSQCTYVISGKYEFTIGDETNVVQQGDSLYIAPDAVHGIKCLEPGELIDVFSPAREDFLK
ncbi:MAG: cupin domain-containing protein [Petrimonas sp.]|nr:cupin domain-containing protein [Petrimonas sp.]